jgi:hypothetical protein
MVSKEKSIAWLRQRTAEYCSQENGKTEVAEDLDEIKKLGLAFLLVDELQEVNLGGQEVSRPTYVKATLDEEQKDRIYGLL